MSARLRRRSVGPEIAAEDGPFVSFTDLAIGIIFLFLILIAALILMHEAAMQKAREEAQRMAEQIRLLQAELDAIKKLDADHTPFRLGIVYNSFQRPAGSDADWKYTRTVQVFRAPNGNCLENVIMRNNLNLAWKPPVDAGDIPTNGSPTSSQTGAPCTLSGSGERWNSTTETGGVDRANANLYTGYTVLHATDGDKNVEIQFRVLGVYDDYFRAGGAPAGARLPPPPPPSKDKAPTGTHSLS
jgi:hypothetical protein